MSRLLLPGLLLVGALLSGCTPAPVYRLEALADEDAARWSFGRQFVQGEADGVFVEVAYVRTTDEGHAFDVTLTNERATDVHVDPRQFFGVYRRVLGADAEAVVAAVMGDTVYAVDPETRLLTLDLAASRAEARRRTAATLHAVDVVLDAADDVASLGQRTAAERRAEAEETQARTEARAAERAEHEHTAWVLNDDRSRWAETTIRRTTLPPGATLYGYVYIPHDERARYLVVHVPFGDDVMEVPYRVYRYQP